MISGMRARRLSTRPRRRSPSRDRTCDCPPCEGGALPLSYRTRRGGEPYLRRPCPTSVLKGWSQTYPRLALPVCGNRPALAPPSSLSRRDRPGATWLGEYVDTRGIEPPRLPVYHSGSRWVIKPIRHRMCPCSVVSRLGRESNPHGQLCRPTLAPCSPSRVPRCPSWN